MEYNIEYKNLFYTINIEEPDLVLGIPRLI